MPLTADNSVQTNTGYDTATTTNHVVTLSATTADNTVVVVIGCSSGVTAPAGFVVGVAAVGVSIYTKPVVAGETSWTFTTGSAIVAAWYAEELTNVDLVSPADASSSGSGTFGNGGTLSTGTTGPTAGLSTVAYAGFTRLNNASTTATWGSFTNGFTQIAEVDDTGGTATQSLTVARAFMDGTTGTYETTGTLTTTDSSQTNGASVVALHAADAPIAAPLMYIAGFEWGTHGGMGTGGATSLMTGILGAGGTWGTNYLIQAGSARNSSYGLRVTTTSASSYVPIGNYNLASVTLGMNVRVVSATGTVRVAVFDTNASDLHLVYNASTTQFGVQWGAGTITYQSGTTALNTWVWVEVRVRTNATTHHAEWRIETGTNTYTDQTAVDLAGQSATAVTTGVLLGGDVAFSQTATVDLDDVVLSRYWAAWPLTPHQIRLLVPETTGASVSGTSTNFSKFTANGTLAAWASDAGALLDDAPPTISASADGVVQTAVAASDYMQFPMATYTCASDEVVAAVRALFPEWGGTGTGTGTIGYRGWDGTTETTFVVASASYDADSLTAASGTYPLWKCAMWPSGIGWTQTELDAAALRVGFSTDATPDMGIHAAYLEVAILKTPVYRQVTMGDVDEFTVDLRVHPYNSATVSYLISSADPTRGATFNYSVSGTPQAPVYVAPSTTQEVVVNATSFGDISIDGFEPDPLA